MIIYISYTDLDLEVWDFEHYTNIFTSTFTLNFYFYLYNYKTIRIQILALN